MNARQATSRVLFVCRHNAVRSQIAEALMRRRVGDGVEVTSAGVDPGPVPEYVQTWVEHLDGGHGPLRSKPLSDFVDQRFDAVITLCDKSHAALAEHPHDHRHIRWDFHHPDDAASLRQLEIELADRIDLLVQANHWQESRAEAGSN